MRENTPDHFCPGCGKRQKLFVRYPWYICSDCVKLVRDFKGRGLIFFNTGLSGGFGWGYRDEPALVMTKGVSRVLCLLGNRKVITGEARFGGIVCEPFGRSFPVDHSEVPYLIDLSRAYDYDAMRRNMQVI